MYQCERKITSGVLIGSVKVAFSRVLGIQIRFVQAPHGEASVFEWCWNPTWNVGRSSWHLGSKLLQYTIPTTSIQ